MVPWLNSMLSSTVVGSEINDGDHLYKSGEHAVAGRWLECAGAYAANLRISNREPSADLTRPYQLRGLASVCSREIAGKSVPQVLNVVKARADLLAILAILQW